MDHRSKISDVAVILTLMSSVMTVTTPVYPSAQDLGWRQEERCRDRRMAGRGVRSSFGAFVALFVALVPLVDAFLPSASPLVLGLGARLRSRAAPHRHGGVVGGRMSTKIAGSQGMDQGNTVKKAVPGSSIVRRPPPICGKEEVRKFVPGRAYQRCPLGVVAPSHPHCLCPLTAAGFVCGKD